MTSQPEFCDILRSGTRVRESVRSLPKGHFQQIRQMFENQTRSPLRLSTIYEQQPKPIRPNVLLRLPVNDDAKLKHSTVQVNMDDEKSLEERYQNYLNEYQTFRLKLANEFLEHKTLYPSKCNENLFNQFISTSRETHFNQEAFTNTSPTSSQQQQPLSIQEATISAFSPFNQHRQSSMSSVANYTDSYDSLISNSLNRAGSSRRYVSTLHGTSDIYNADSAHLIAPSTSHVIETNSTILLSETQNLAKTSRRLHSSTSLSSTGYDSNSSPSIRSKRNSTATTNSNDFMVHSAYSSPSSSCPSSSASSASSSDEQQQQQQRELSKPWIPYKPSTRNLSFCDDSTCKSDLHESSNQSPPLVSRTEIKLNQPTADQRPHQVTCYAVVRSPNSVGSPPSVHEPIIAPRSTTNLAYIMQTTSFPNQNDTKTDKKIRRWNNFFPERIDITNAMNRKSKPLRSTGSTGFDVMNLNGGQEHIDDGSFSPISIPNQNTITPVESPALDRVPPKKPPRTFQQEDLRKSKDRKTEISSSSDVGSPTLDSRNRSISCMNLATNVTNVLSCNDVQIIEKDDANSIVRRPITFSDRPAKKLISNGPISESINVPLKSTIIGNDNRGRCLYNSTQSELNTINDKSDSIINTPITKRKLAQQHTTKKSTMKKGVSEPNLTKTARSKSPFSPRGLLERFKRMLPLSSSKQSLNGKTANLNESTSNINDSDDSVSLSSDNNENIRTSRLDHVSRVKNVYDSLNTSNRISSLLFDPTLYVIPNEITTLYDYVVHLLPEQELGYFANGNGCLISSNFNSQKQLSTSTSVHFKYPLDAKDEVALKHFCFPDQHDANNNPLILKKKTSQDYFRFTLTNMHGCRQYGYCSRFFYKGVLNALCIVSPYDIIEVYEKILSTATELFLSYKEHDAKQFLAEIYCHRIPNRGDTIHIQTTTVGLFTLKCEYDRRKVLIDSVTLLSLSTDTIIKIFSSILYEQKLIFIGNDIGQLTRLINTFVALLYPFSWPHTYIPVLPALMLDVIQAPTPYIIGILRSCESYLTVNDEFLSQDSSDILIIDIDHNRTRSINDYINGNASHGSTDNLHHFPLTNPEPTRFQILPKIFKIELKQEISQLRKTRLSLSLDECQQRLHDVFMSIFVQSCYNYKDFYSDGFKREKFLQSKQHTIELFLEWFTRTQIFELFIRQKFELNGSSQYAKTFDLACEKHMKTISKQTPQRITVKSIKRKSATRTTKQENRF